jgi:glycosyltransferase involved in cell wall biosynthesis
MSNSSVSFIIPAYNCADTLRQAVDSIVTGNFGKGDEIVIVEDCSTDNTREVLALLQQEYPFVRILYNVQNLGCAQSRNIGIESAINPLLFNLDSDNILAPRTVTLLREYLIANKVDIVTFGEIHYFIEDPKKITHKWIFPPGPHTLSDYLAGVYQPGSSGNFLYTKESWHRVGKYDEFGGAIESWGFTLKQIANGSNVISMPGSHYYHRYGYDSLYTRAAKDPAAISLLATRMITPYLELLHEDDAVYIASDVGKREWFHKLDQHPIKVKSATIGKTGKSVNLSHTRRYRLSRFRKIFRNIFIRKQKHVQ